MPRSSFSDNPLLRVSRPVSACSRCRAAKVKCDGKLPACTACEKAGRESECSAANDQFARGKERSYVAALELRVEKLERRLAYARSRKASVAFHDGDAGFAAAHDDSRKGSLAAIRAAIHRKAARKRENSDVNSLVSDFGYLSVNATTRDFEPSVNNMTFARLVLAAAGNVPLPESALTPLRMPSRPAAYAIVQYYLSHVHVLFPFFPETSLLALLEELYHHQQPPMAPPNLLGGPHGPHGLHGPHSLHGPPSRPNLRSADYWMLYMVLAIGSSAQSRSRQDALYTNGVEFAAHAMPYADRALAPGHVTQIQSLLLLTLYSMLDPAHFDSWHLIGFTCRAVVDLGFHQDPPPSQNMDAAALDARRRTFYCAYALDRAISMVHARAFSFTDDAINVAFPSMIGVLPSSLAAAAAAAGGGGHASRSHAAGAGAVAGAGAGAGQPPASPSSVPPSANPALLLFQLRRAQSHWYQTLYQSDPSEQLAEPAAFVWRMCADMREWYDALPVTLPGRIREMFDLELRYSYVYCIAPSARAPLMTAYGRMLIFEHVVAYVDRIVALVRGGLNPVWHTYHDALRMFFMGSQFVAVLRDPATADAILAGPGSVPIPMPLPGGTLPPPLPVRSILSVPPPPPPPPPMPPLVNSLPSNHGGNNGESSSSSSSNLGMNSRSIYNGGDTGTHSPDGLLPPPLSSVDPVAGNNVDRAVACLERVSWTLSAYGARWEDAERLAAGFKSISRTVLESLWARQAAQGKQPPPPGAANPAAPAHAQPTGMALQHPHPQQQQQQQQRQHLHQQQNLQQQHAFVPYQQLMQHPQQHLQQDHQHHPQLDQHHPPQHFQFQPQPQPLRQLQGAAPPLRYVHTMHPPQQLPPGAR